MRIFFLFILLHSARAFCQDTSTLPTVLIQAFEKEQHLLKVAAPVSVATSTIISGADPSSMVTAVNALPGVRLEERSPGSYRLNIRASSLRSPFGVRNVKVYLNELPFTEPGGHTYFNQLGYYNVASLEIIRGPASSIYGAGTGGIMLIKTITDQDQGLSFAYTAGSYASNNFYARAVTRSKATVNLIGYQHQQSNGYRDHSESKRQVFNFTSATEFNKGSLITTILYGNLFYETPGGITLQAYQANPRSSRPATPVFPSAKDAGASVKQQMIYGGTSLQYNISSSFRNKTGVYGMYTTLRNPNIQGYDKSDEPHHGFRSVFSLKKRKFEVETGIEYQNGNPEIKSFANESGQPGEERSYDKVNNKRSMVFIQGTYNFKNWILTASGSYNSLHISSNRISGSGPLKTDVHFKDYAPRLSLLKYFKNFSLFTAVSSGFSPPTTQEIIPSGGERNPLLEAEKGINVEAGTKGNFRRWSWDLNIFSYRLKNTIVQRRTPGGGDYYVNAGSTRQTGTEFLATYDLRNSWLASGSQFRIGYTYYNFRYRDFVRVDEKFSGNKMPSVPRHLVNSSVHIYRGSLYTSILFEYIGEIPLNDANDAFANDAAVLGLRLGWKLKMRLKPALFVAVANVFNERYSLGNDFNAFGGRYYNAAPGRNYSAGVSFNMPWQ